jgi:hypothetical protein
VLSERRENGQPAVDRCPAQSRRAAIVLRSGELRFALESPVRERYGVFAGHPWIRGTITWSLPERRNVCCAQRGGASLEETPA